MTPYDVLRDSFGRIAEGVPTLLDGLDQDALGFRAGPRANTIAWLVWHLARVQDAQVADVAGTSQVWIEQGFAARFGLPFDDRATGYGQTPDEVAQVRVDADLLADYMSATHEATLRFLDTEPDLDAVVDTRWHPPVTLGARLVSIVDDDAKHLGQAEFVRGLVRAR